MNPTMWEELEDDLKEEDEDAEYAPCVEAFLYNEELARDSGVL